jgi:hypothetical protein
MKSGNAWLSVMTEAVRSSETSVTIYQTTQYHVPKFSNLQEEYYILGCVGLMEDYRRFGGTCYLHL